MMILIAAVLLGQLAPGSQSVLEDGSKPTLLQNEGAGEGPAWHARLGLLTSGEGHINRRAIDGSKTIYRRDAGSNGLLIDREGRLVICEPVRRRITRLAPDGTLTVLTDQFEGKKFNQPNDLTLDSKGRIYFSDPRYGERSDMQIRDSEGRTIEGVYRIDPDGKVTRVIGREVERANGVLVTPDDRFLFVADNNNDTLGGARKLWRFPLNTDGSVDLKNKQLIHDWGSTRGPDGMKIDQAGHLFVAGGLNRPNPPSEIQDKPTAGIYVFSPEGKLLEFIAIPRDEVTNCGFGGEDKKTLFVTAGGSLWSMRVRVPGRLLWP
jgi:gluconolactonase